MQKGRFKLCNLLTYFDIASTVLAMIFAERGFISIAMICLVMTGILDVFDGKFASCFKRTNEEKLIGIEMDSLADVANFLICPVIIGMNMGIHAWYAYVIFILYVIAGITRLACYNVNTAENHVDKAVKYYNGLPVTYAATIFPLAWLLHGVLDTNILRVIYLLLFSVVGFLFVADIKIPKPNKAGRIAFSIAAVIGVILIFAMM